MLEIKWREIGKSSTILETLIFMIQQKNCYNNINSTDIRLLFCSNLNSKLLWTTQDEHSIVSTKNRLNLLSGFIFLLFNGFFPIHFFMIWLTFFWRNFRTFIFSVIYFHTFSYRVWILGPFWAVLKYLGLT